MKSVHNNALQVAMIVHGNVQDVWEVRDLWLGLCGCSRGWGHGTSARYVSQVAEEKQVWMDLKPSELTLKICNRPLR